MKRKLNIFDRIGTLIPGYKGYQERDGRRECDRQLREQISDKLTSIEKIINSLIENTSFDNLSEVAKVQKKINNLNSLIRYSPYGETAFFSNSVIKENELDRIYQFDLSVLDFTNDLNEAVKSEDMNEINANISLLESSIYDRNQYIKNI